MAIGVWRSGFPICHNGAGADVALTLDVSQQMVGVRISTLHEQSHKKSS